MIFELKLLIYSLIMAKRFNKKIFEEGGREVHGDKYDYTFVVYENCDKKVIIVCPDHGPFEQSYSKHVKLKRGCSKCNGGVKLTNDEFLLKANNVHNNKYTYPEKYNKSMKIICPVHGPFEQLSHHHLSGSGCRKCNNETIKYNQLTTQIFNERSTIKHNGFFDYSLVNYKNSYTNVTIICPEHGPFEQIASNHMNLGRGCSKCTESKGEKYISNYLDIIEVNYVQQHKFNDCRNIYPLPFDFYLPKYNICIEFDGKQHFVANEFFGGDVEFKKRQNNDKIKNIYCNENKINLLRISYDKIDDIENIIYSYIEKIKEI